MEIIDEVHQVLRCPVTAGGRKVTGRLVTPGSEKGVLRKRQKLDVSETRLGDVVRQWFSNLAVVQRPVVLLGNAAPRSQMNLVYRYRRLDAAPFTSTRHP